MNNTHILSKFVVDESILYNYDGTRYKLIKIIQRRANVVYLYSKKYDDFLKKIVSSNIPLCIWGIIYDYADGRLLTLQKIYDIYDEEAISKTINLINTAISLPRTLCKSETKYFLADFPIGGIIRDWNEHEKLLMGPYRIIIGICAIYNIFYHRTKIVRKINGTWEFLFPSKICGFTTDMDNSLICLTDVDSNLIKKYKLLPEC